MRRIGAFAAAAALPRVVVSPSPFDHVRCLPGGLDLPSAGPCVPPAAGNYSVAVWEELLRSTRDALRATAGRRVQVMTAQQEWAQALWQQHIELPGGGWDCLHHCRGAVPSLELFFLARALRAGHELRGGAAPAPAPGDSQQPRACRPVAFQFASGAPDEGLARDAFGHRLPATPGV